MAEAALAPAKLGPVQLRNRTIKAATYEGMCRDGLVTDALIDFHRRFAAGGVGMTTVAYLAVAPEGRTDGSQVYWRPDALPGLRRLTDAVHAEGAAISAQIGHAGPVAHPGQTRLPALSPSRMFQPLGMQFCRVPDAHDLARIVRQHAEAARMAIDVGFDAVEIHFGHNYLISAFLSPNLNRRKDGYGGSLANRARLARETATAVREAVDGEIAVTAKLNMTDRVRGGFEVDESLQVARWLQDDGSLDALELTAGSSLLNPMYLFHGDAPLREFAAALPAPAPVRLGMRASGQRFLRVYPYRDLYLLEHARRFREALTLPLILLGGITGREGVDQAMDEGFEFVAMGRALLYEPGLVNRMATDEAAKSGCIHCNRCMPTIYTGTRCVLH